MGYDHLAEKSLQGVPLTHDECLSVLHASDTEILSLLQAAFRVRERHCGRRVRIHMLVNAKSGLCSENCAYCSQSSVSKAPIDRYPLLDQESLVRGAHEAKAAKATRY
jgi:biotin synthase